MGLQKQNMRHFHAGLCFKSTQQVPTGCPQAPATHTIKVYHARVWGKNSICNKRWKTSSHGQTVSHYKKFTGAVLYYARAVDPTVLMPLNDIAMEQTKATEKTQAAANQLLDYLATHPDATIRYHASDMILYIHSDAS
jgi:hypothetical protein